MVPAAAGVKVKVSFIIGADGRVHSPLILESAGLAGDRNVLQTVRGVALPSGDLQRRA